MYECTGAVNLPLHDLANYRGSARLAAVTHPRPVASLCFTFQRRVSTLSARDQRNGGEGRSIRLRISHDPIPQTVEVLPLTKVELRSLRSRLFTEGTLVQSQGCYTSSRTLKDAWISSRITQYACANPALHRNIVLNLITSEANRRMRPSVNRRISITGPLRRVSVRASLSSPSGARYRAKNSQTAGRVAKKTFRSAIKDTAIIPHSRSAFDRNFPPKRSRTPFG